VKGVDDALKQVDEWPVGNVAVAVVGPDGVLADRGDRDRLFPLASVTKPLTALACLVAVEEGAIGLDDAAGPPGSTVRHLLAHASGLAPDKPEPMSQPGTRRIYSNAGFEALGAHVAAATGMAFGEYLRQAVCAPLGLAATTPGDSAATGATSTVADLAVVAAQLLHPRGLLHPDTVAQARTVQFPGLAGVLPGYGRQDPNDWGLGFEIRGRKRPHWTGERNSASTFGHFGQSGTFLWVDPEAGLACVTLTDRAFGDWALERWPALNSAILTGSFS
jgi:CubicO group peptidase (beta-lactamase class C family)